MKVILSVVCFSLGFVLDIALPSPHGGLIMFFAGVIVGSIVEEK